MSEVCPRCKFGILTLSTCGWMCPACGYTVWSGEYPHLTYYTVQAILENENKKD